ncbi:MAG: RIP metalloprotease RseP [Chitinispirillales bacterium]|jgi:regulator of sigma E protease|nr:RIP metalloprotease RseP [Chitinispirillales bacterium]
MLTIIFGLIILGILIFVHELGHFLAAKACGIRVLTFSLGFGQPLLNKKIGETEYRISAIPFGGYVKMAGENVDDIRGGEDEYLSRPVWQRAVVAAAGPFFNVFFAFLFLFIANVYGIDEPRFMRNMTVGAIVPASAAQAAGFLPGDSITAINGKTVNSWDEVQNFFLRGKTSYTVQVSRQGEILDLHLQMKRVKGERYAGMAGLAPEVPAVIGNVTKNSAAQEAGLMAGDTIVFAYGDTLRSAIQLNILTENWTPQNGPIEIKVKRSEGDFSTTVTPKFDSTANRHLLGIAFAAPATQKIRYSPLNAVYRSGTQMWEFTTLIFRVLHGLTTGGAAASDMAGPVGIIQISGQVAQHGVSTILIFMAMLGVNLALINLLPLVITDGGQLLFLLIEAVRGKPLTPKTQGLINMIAVIFFISLFVFLTFNDILRIFR